MLVPVLSTLTLASVLIGYKCLPPFIVMLLLLLRLTHTLCPIAFFRLSFRRNNNERMIPHSLFFCLLGGALVLDPDLYPEHVHWFGCTAMLHDDIYNTANNNQNGCSGSTPAGAAETPTRGKRT